MLLYSLRRKNVLSFSMIKDRLLFCNSDKELILDNEIVDSKVDSQNYFFWLDKVIYIKGDYTYVHSNGLNTLLIKKSILQESLNKDGYAIFSYDFDYLAFTMKYEQAAIDNYRISRRIYGVEYIKLIYSYDDFYFIYDGKSETIFKNIVSSNSWKFNLSSSIRFTAPDGDIIKFEFIKILGVSDKKVWVSVAHKTIIFIDMDTGVLVDTLYLPHYLNLVEPASLEDNFVAGDMYIDETAGILKSLSYRYYWELDLKTLKGEIKKDFGIDFTNSWRITKSRYYEGDKNLYFIGARKGEAVNRAVGIFDTEKCEVIWYDEPLEERKFLFYTDTPQRNDTHLAVLDSENNLWVYEREK